MKNTLLAKALEKVEKADAELVKVLEGSTSIMFANVAKAPAVLIKEFRKKSEKPVLKAAFAEGCVYVGDNAVGTPCATSSRREELIGDIIALLQSPGEERYLRTAGLLPAKRSQGWLKPSKQGDNISGRFAGGRYREIRLSLQPKEWFRN